MGQLWKTLTHQRVGKCWNKCYVCRWSFYGLLKADERITSWQDFFQWPWDLQTAWGNRLLALKGFSFLCFYSQPCHTEFISLYPLSSSGGRPERKKPNDFFFFINLIRNASHGWILRRIDPWFVYTAIASTWLAWDAAGPKLIYTWCTLTLQNRYPSMHHSSLWSMNHFHISPLHNAGQAASPWVHTTNVV